MARTDTKLILMERDIAIINEVSRWRFLLGRQIKELFSFPSQRACDRRIEKLTKNGYLEPKNILVGFPRLYFLGSQAKKLETVVRYSTKQNLSRIDHDIAVVDTALYFIKNYGVKLENIMTERQLRAEDGFGIRTHKPDFVFSIRGKTACTEVEFTAKSKEKFTENMTTNFMNYDHQFWIVPQNQKKILALFNDTNMANSRVIYWEIIASHVRPKK